MIKPTVGRVVWYWGSKDYVKNAPLAALVCFVASDEIVNLVVFDSEGMNFPRPRVRLVQDLEKAIASDNLPDSEFCTWMPFQKAQPQIATTIEERLKALEAAAQPTQQVDLDKCIQDVISEKMKVYLTEQANKEPGSSQPPADTKATAVIPPVKQVTK